MELINSSERGEKLKRDNAWSWEKAMDCKDRKVWSDAVNGVGIN